LAGQKFKKGDVILVDEKGKAVKYEILSVVASDRVQRMAGETCYEVRSTASGSRKTISDVDILRLASPVDNSADLFPRRDNE
jgi:hypothetical protein